MKPIIIILGLSIISFAVAAGQLKKAEPVITNYSNVEDCQVIKQVDVDSGYGKHISEEEWQHLVVHKALLQGERSCATHMVVDELDPIGSFNGHLHATLYRCRQLPGGCDVHSSGS